MRKPVKPLDPPDFVLLATVLVLVVVGLLLVFDASYAKTADTRSMNYDPWYLIKRQAPFALLGLIAMCCAMCTRLSTIRKATPYVLAASVVLLVAVLVPGIGHKSHGARSWIYIAGVSFQPSEIAKIAMVMYLAAALCGARIFARRAKKRWLLPAGIAAGMLGLIFLEHDLGSAVLFAMVCLLVFFSAGAKFRYVALTVIVGLLLVAGAMTQMGHTQARVRAWLDPWEHRFDEGYQTVHSLAGLGTGGLKGVGLCEGREKFYLPAAHTDYIFVTLGEEAGLIGGLLLLGAFLLFTYRGLHIASKCRSNYASILASGVVALISAQAIINVAVVTSAIPATGLPLPFISYGGSCIVSMMLCAGILLSVSRQLSDPQGEFEADESSSDGGRHGRAHLPRSKRRPGASGGGTNYRAAVRR